MYLKRNAKAKLFADSSVKKNFTITELAQSLQEMSEAAKHKDYRFTERILNSSIALRALTGGRAVRAPTGEYFQIVHR